MPRRLTFLSLALATCSVGLLAFAAASRPAALAEAGMPIEEGTLYPLLRRLESQGILASEWRIQDGPPRRYYTLSPEGVRHYESLCASWTDLAKTVGRLISHRK